MLVHGIMDATGDFENSVFARIVPDGFGYVRTGLEAEF
jgi:hypothetical protein